MFNIILERIVVSMALEMFHSLVPGAYLRHLLDSAPSLGGSWHVIWAQ
eukprot:gene16280-4954_t